MKKDKRYIVETIFLKESVKHKLSLNEFLVLMYFDNADDLTFDVKKLSKAIFLSEKDILNAFGLLLDKNLIVLKSDKDANGKIYEKVSLENLYYNLDENKKDETNKNAFFDKFQKEYKHSLSGMDYEIINAWLEAGFSEELILGALNEAIYNEVKSPIRYIDKILYEWSKKGFKSMKDVNEHLKNRNVNIEEKYEENVLEYNWLDEE